MPKEMITSAAANKMLKQLQDEKAYLLQLEKESATYIQVTGYDTEKPEYDYEKIYTQIRVIDDKIGQIKHAINVFNCSTELPELGFTVDAALVKLAQLTKEKERLDIMRKRLPKTRRQNRYGDSGNLVEYTCTNYDIEQTKEDYNTVCEEIIKIQMGIDYVNQTQKFEIEI